jgi:chromate transporter
MSAVHEPQCADTFRPAPVTAWQLFRVWLGIGLQSFGGGTATLYLIRRTVVERHGWLTDEEFTRFWGICQIAPGINLLGQTILIGRKVGGVPGAMMALLGLLLPSAIITVLITAGYASVRDLPMMAQALHGVVPATVGLGLLLAYQMAAPPIAESRKEGRPGLIFSVALLLGSALLVGLVGAPIIGVLWGTGAMSAVWAWQRARKTP